MDCNYINYSILIFERAPKEFVAVFPDLSNLLQESGETIVECEENAKIRLAKLLYSFIENNQLLPNPANENTLKVRMSLPLDKLVKTSFVQLSIDYGTMSSLTNRSQSSTNYLFVTDQESMCKYIEFSIGLLVKDFDAVFTENDPHRNSLRIYLEAYKLKYIEAAKDLEGDIFDHYEQYSELNAKLQQTIFETIRTLKLFMINMKKHNVCYPHIEILLNPPVRNKQKTEGFYLFPTFDVAREIFNLEPPFLLRGKAQRTFVSEVPIPPAGAIDIGISDTEFSAIEKYLTEAKIMLGV